MIKLKQFGNPLKPYKWSLSVGELKISSGTISGSFLPDMGPSTSVERYENIFEADDFDSEFVDFVEEQGDLWTLPVGEFFGSTITYKKQCAGQFSSKEEELFQYKHSRKDQFKLQLTYYRRLSEVTTVCRKTTVYS